MFTTDLDPPWKQGSFNIRFKYRRKKQVYKVSTVWMVERKAGSLSRCSTVAHVSCCRQVGG